MKKQNNVKIAFKVLKSFSKSSTVVDMSHLWKIKELSNNRCIATFKCFTDNLFIDVSKYLIDCDAKTLEYLDTTLVFESDFLLEKLKKIL